MHINTTANTGKRLLEARAVVVGHPINRILVDVRIRHPHSRRDIKVTPAEYCLVTRALSEACTPEAGA